MKLTVYIQPLLATLGTALAEDDKNYKKAMQLYAKKVGDYAKYLDLYLETNMSRPLKLPPPIPSWRHEALKDSLDALRAHAEPTVEMDDDEYRNITHGIENLRVSGNATIAALEEYSASD